MGKMVTGYRSNLFGVTDYLADFSKELYDSIDVDKEIDRYKNSKMIRQELKQMDEENQRKCVGVLYRANQHSDKFKENQ